MIEIIGVSLVLALIIFLSFKNYLLVKENKVISGSKIIYADRSGIGVNPPTQFIDVWANKTINFKLGGSTDPEFVVSIAQLPIFMCMDYVKRISHLFQLLCEYLEVKPQDEIKKLKLDALYIEIFNNIINNIYELSHPFIKNKKRFRKLLFEECQKDVHLTIHICEQVSDYWKLVKKKAQILGQATTLRQMHGVDTLWSNTNLDAKGKILRGARFGKFWNSYKSKMKKSSEQTNQDNGKS